MVQALRRLGGLVYEEDRMTIVLKDLRSIAEPKKEMPLTVEKLERRHLEGLAELNRKRRRQRSDRRFRRYLDRGMHGFVGVLGGEVVGYYWWVEGDRADAHPDLGWLGPAIAIGREDAYGSDFYLLPEHRGGGLANVFLYQVESALRERGLTWLWGYVDHGNRQARWLYGSRGYRSMGEVSSRRVLSVRTKAIGTDGRIPHP
jgi:GNAT superfamily N-acetyltransferase